MTKHPEVTIRQPTRKDVADAHGKVRAKDIGEWIGGTGITFFDGASAAADSDQNAYARIAFIGDEPMLCWGVDWGGNIWMWATELAVKHSITLHRELLREVDTMHEMVGTLYAVADSRNTQHHIWLEWLGFTLMHEKPRPPFGMMFRAYKKEVPDVL